MYIETPDNFDAYEILGLLGKDNFGSTSRVKRTSDGLIFAMKKHPCLAFKEEEKIKKKFAILASLHHANIVEFIEAFMHELHYIVISELCLNGDLYHYYERLKGKGEYITED